MLDGVDRDLVLDRSAGQLRLRIIRPVLNRERFFFAYLRSEKVLRKFLQRSAPADFRDSLLAGDWRLFAAFDRAVEGNLGKVAFLDWALFFDRNQFRHFLLKFLQ